MTDQIPAEISDWAEEVGRALADSRLRLEAMHEQAAIMRAATADVALAYGVIVVLARTVALVLRPGGHEGGPIGLEARRSDPTAGRDPVWLRAAQLVGFAAQDDHQMVDALVRAALATPDPLLEARSTLWAILEVLSSEPVDPNPKGTP